MVTYNGGQEKRCEERSFVEDKKVYIVKVRWWDEYFETFDCTDVRFGSDLLWLILLGGNNRHIPLRGIRWFSMD